MKEQITRINASIDAKRQLLKEKADRQFSTIQTIAGSSQRMPQVQANKPKPTPPISYILYGIAGVALLGTLVAESKSPLALLTVASAAGGYWLSRPKQKPAPQTAGDTLDTTRSRVVEKVVDTVKNISNEWETFMAQMQKEVQQVMRENVQEDLQDEMLAAVCLYEILDIRTSAFLDAANRADSPEQLRQVVASFNQSLSEAIDKAAEKQKGKYSALLNV